jgi:protein-S-isoprenylcysteine O-methyltransferase Ste14
MEYGRAERSPWWYRQRGSVYGAIYGSGFFFGYLTLNGHAQHPVSDAWGQRFAGGQGGAVLLWGAVVCALVAWLWRASGTAFLRRNVVFAADVQRDRLIVAGPFRYVRNPLYVGNIFLALAIAVLAPPLGFVIIVAGNIAFSVLLGNEESRGMAERYGAVYEAYRKAVPAFVPRLTPATVPGSDSPHPSWRAALLGDAFCLTLAVAIAVVAVFGQAGLPAFWAIWILSLIVFGILGWRDGRSKSSGAAP